VFLQGKPSEVRILPLLPVKGTETAVQCLLKFLKKARKLTAKDQAPTSKKKGKKKKKAKA